MENNTNNNEKKFNLPKTKEEWKAFGKKVGKAAIKVAVVAGAFTLGAICGSKIKHDQTSDEPDALPSGDELYEDGETYEDPDEDDTEESEEEADAE